VTDIARLVRSAQAGDGEAFAELYQRFARMVHGVVLARIARTEVDDVVQDVFMAAFERLGELREPAAFGGWLAAIARNRAADHGRRLMPVHPVVDARLRRARTNGSRRSRSSTASGRCRRPTPRRSCSGWSRA
jgi:RNA polymerase sigma-70 factor (ECF subfamily)